MKRTITLAFITTSVVSAVAAISINSEAVPPTYDDCEPIRKAISELPKQGGTIELEAKTYLCSSMVVIDRDNVVFRGAGQDKTILKLADYSHAPVLVIGDATSIYRNGEWVPERRVTNVKVSNLTIDGNLANQNPVNECGNHDCEGDAISIRNNGITVRGASDISIQNVTTHSCISGGLVTEKYSTQVKVKNLTSYGNYFDGIAGCQTENSLFEDLNLFGNRMAGISLDIDFQNNHFRNAQLHENRDVGVFARDVRGNLFENLQIRNSGNHGVYMSYVHGPETCASNNEFKDVSVLGSNGHGVHLGSDCADNRVTGSSHLIKNRLGCTFSPPGTVFPVSVETTCED